MSSSVKVFRLSREARRTADRLQLITTSIVTGMVLLCLGAIALVAQSVPASFGVLPIIFAGVLVVAWVRGKRQIGAKQAAFGIALGPDVIRMVTADSPPVEMTRDEVVRILEAPSGLGVQAESPPRQVFLPRTLDGYDEARGVLATWRTLEQVGSERAKVVRLVLWQAIGILAFVGAVVSADVRVVAIASAVLLPLLVLGFRGVLRERYFPPALRSVALLCLGVATLALVARWALYFYGRSVQ